MVESLAGVGAIDKRMTEKPALQSVSYVPKTLLFGTASDRLDLSRQKPSSRPKQFLKVFGSLMIADIHALCSIGQSGLIADL